MMNNPVLNQLVLQINEEMTIRVDVYHYRKSSEMFRKVVFDYVSKGGYHLDSCWLSCCLWCKPLLSEIESRVGVDILRKITEFVNPKSKKIIPEHPGYNLHRFPEDFLKAKLRLSFMVGERSVEELFARYYYYHRCRTRLLYDIYVCSTY